MEINKLNKAVEILSNISPLLMKNMVQPVRQQFSLTTGMHFILHLLEKGQSLTMTDLSKRLLIPKPNTTGIVDKMIKNGLIVRVDDKNDRRKVKIQLSSKGLKISNQLNESIAQNIRSKLELLSETELEVLYESLTNVHNLLTKISIDSLESL